MDEPIVHFKVEEKLLEQWSSHSLPPYSLIQIAWKILCHHIEELFFPLEGEVGIPHFQYARMTQELEDLKLPVLVTFVL
jgi:hypothetical protein